MYALLGVILLSRFLAHQWIEQLSATRECNRDVVEIGDRVAVVVDVHGVHRGHEVATIKKSYPIIVGKTEELGLNLNTKIDELLLH